MNERNLYGIFKKKIKEADPNCFWWKIPDTFNLGGKKCFDGILVVKGTPFAIEFKSKNGIITKYQMYQLADFINAGGESLVYRNGNESMDAFIQKIIAIANKKSIR